MAINFLNPDGTMGGGLSFGNGQYDSYRLPNIPNLPNLANDTRGYEVTPDNQYAQLPNIQSFINQYKPQMEQLYSQHKPQIMTLLERLKTSQLNTLNTPATSNNSSGSINPAKQTAIKKLMSKQLTTDKLRKNKIKENSLRFQNAQQLTRTTDDTQKDTNNLQADLMAKLYI